MSINNILSPNSYDLFCKKFTANETVLGLIEAAEARVDNLSSTTFSATDGDITNLLGFSATIANADLPNIINTNLTSVNGTLTNILSDKIKGTTGFNYLSPWDATKSYVIGDLVISSGQLWRCLVANTNVVPDPNNPAQAQWAQITSNNAILNERQYIQVNNTVGNDAKALVSPLPFATVNGAINYLATISGGVARMTTIAATYNEGIGVIDKTGLVNVSIDGGDLTGSVVDNPNNIIDAYMIFNDCTKLNFSNLSLTRSDPSNTIYFVTRGCRDVSMNNVTFIDNSLANQYLMNIRDQPSGPIPFGSHYFNNCTIKTGNDLTFALNLSGPCDANTDIVIDSSAPTARSFYTITSAGVTTPENLRLVVRNCMVNVISPVAGATYIFINCIFMASFSLTASTGAVYMYNCTFTNPITNTWANLNLNLSGSARYYLSDVLTNPNSNSNSLVAPGTTSYNLTSGPASRFNRSAYFGIGSGVSLTSATALHLPVGTLTSDPFGLLSTAGVAGTFRFAVAGTYLLSLTLLLQNTSTAADVNAVNVWFSRLGITENTANGLTCVSRGLTSAGNLATYPNGVYTVTLRVTIASGFVNTDYYVYARNLGSTSFQSNLNALEVMQVS